MGSGSQAERPYRKSLSSILYHACDGNLANVPIIRKMPYRDLLWFLCERKYQSVKTK